MKKALIALVAPSLAFAGVTGWALESGGVAVVQTRRADGTHRSTHVWYVEPDGELWLEAGSPRNGWFVDAEQHPELRLVIDGSSRAYAARPLADPAGHDRIRELIRAKYGFRDVWVNLIVDTSRSVAVRLEASPAGP